MPIDLIRATNASMSPVQPDPLFKLILELDSERDRYEELRNAPQPISRSWRTSSIG